MHKLKLPNVSRSEVKGSIKITNPINKSLLIVYCSFNFGKENTTISGKTIEGQPYAFPPPQTSTETQIMMILIIYQTLPAALIENSHFNSKLVCLAMLKLYSKVLAKPSPLVSRWRASFQSRHAGIVWYILELIPLLQYKDGAGHQSNNDNSIEVKCEVFTVWKV